MISAANHVKNSIFGFIFRNSCQEERERRKKKDIERTKQICPNKCVIKSLDSGNMEKKQLRK